MTGPVENLPERVQAVERKLDTLSASVDSRFDAVDVALVEQRQYTEFAFLKLDAKMDEGFNRLDAKMDASFGQVDGRFARLERKLDQFIDTQSKANELVERRLRKLEPPSVQQ